MSTQGSIRNQNQHDGDESVSSVKTQRRKNTSPLSTDTDRSNKLEIKWCSSSFISSSVNGSERAEIKRRMSALAVTSEISSMVDVYLEGGDDINDNKEEEDSRADSGYGGKQSGTVITSASSRYGKVSELTEFDHIKEEEEEEDNEVIAMNTLAVAEQGQSIVMSRTKPNKDASETKGNNGHREQKSIEEVPSSEHHGKWQKVYPLLFFMIVGVVLGPIIWWKLTRQKDTDNEAVPEQPPVRENVTKEENRIYSAPINEVAPVSDVQELTASPLYFPTERPSIFLTEKPSRFLTEKPSRSPTDKPSRFPTKHPSAAPTFPPTFPPTTSSPTTTRQNMRREFILEILRPISGSALDQDIDGNSDNSSSQQRALDWILHQDPIHTRSLNAVSDVANSVDVQALTQRYILAVFYYSTVDVSPLPPNDDDEPIYNSPMATRSGRWKRCGADDILLNDDDDIGAGMKTDTSWRCTNENNQQRYKFLSGVSECFWFGIRCSGNRVASINLRDNNLVGSLPEELSHLTSLKSLVLGHNSLFGTLPPALGTNLAKLKTVILNHNDLSGNIPFSFSTLTKLSTFIIGDNRLTGTVPGGLFVSRYERETCALKFFDISDNQLSSQTLLTEVFLGACAQTIKKINIHGNKLGGSMPVISGKPLLPPNLEVLIASDNQFTGYLPNEAFMYASSSNNSPLTYLDLSDNQWTGTIPSVIGNLPHLEELKLSSNDFTGTIPSKICDLRNAKLDILTSDCENSFSIGNGGNIIVTNPKVICECCTVCVEGRDSKFGQ